MLFKLLGSIMVISASTYIGFIYAGNCSKRPQQLRTLQGFLQMLENEISYLSRLLADAFWKISKISSCQTAAFFSEAALHLESGSMNAAKAWELAVKDNVKKTALNLEDREILLSFGKMLGSTDMEGQIKNIRLTMQQLSMQEQKAEESRKKNEAMYRNLGLLGGLAVVIILF